MTTSMKSPQDLLGRELGGFRIERLLGQGGMGVVYQAVELGLGRRVAVKVLPLTWFNTDNDKLTKRFLREARVIAALNHPNLIHLYRAGEQDGIFYYAMEYVEGVTLDKHIIENGPLRDEELGAFSGQILGALGSCHVAGIVHRDVKASNIMLAQADRWLLMDFGLAAVDTPNASNLTQQGTILGTPETMSPEQVEGRSATPQSDLYSFGVVLFQAVTGQLPFTGKSAIAVMQKHLTQPAPRVETLWPEAPVKLADTIHTLMAKDPAQRPSDARLLAARLSDVLDSRELRLVADGRGISVSVHMSSDVDTTAKTVSDSTKVTTPPRSNNNSAIPGSGRPPGTGQHAGGTPTLEVDEAVLGSTEQTIQDATRPTLNMPPRNRTPRALFDETNKSNAKKRMPWIIGGLIVLMAIAIILAMLLSSHDKLPKNDTVTSTPEKPDTTPVKTKTDDNNAQKTNPIPEPETIPQPDSASTTAFWGIDPDTGKPIPLKIKAFSEQSGMFEIWLQGDDGQWRYQQLTYQEMAVKFPVIQPATPSNGSDDPFSNPPKAKPPLRNDGGFRGPDGGLRRGRNDRDHRRGNGARGWNKD